jgi:hypothetical protein
MAHFARIGAGYIIEQVHVVDNSVIMKDGKEDEATGMAFLQNLYGNRETYIQMSYNSTFRKNYVGIGGRYDPDRDAFISPKPYPSWTLDDDTCRWNAPVAYPDDGEMYMWDEANTEWKEME